MWSFPTRDVYTKLQTFLFLPLDYDEIYGLASLLEALQSLQSLESYRGSYDLINIKPDSVIYCDIPYRGTDEYDDGGFDYERFYFWCEKQSEPLYISEYWMPPERFECVAEIEKVVLLCFGSRKKTVEKLFVPKVQIEKGIAEIKKNFVQQEFEF